MRTWIASILLLSAPAAQAQDSPWGVMIQPDQSTISVLPISAEEARRRFGELPPRHSEEARAMLGRILAAAFNASKQSNLPPLFLSRSNSYREAGLSDLRKELEGARITEFDPMSLQKQGDESYAAIVAKLERDAGAAPEFMAVVFAFKEGRIARAVFAFQPWIGLLRSTGRRG